MSDAPTLTPAEQILKGLASDGSIIHPWHMKGWEAIGVTDTDDPLVRRLGFDHHLAKPKYGTEPWGKGETRNGVGSINIYLSADCIEHAYIYVCGTTENGVRVAWHRAADLIRRTGQTTIWNDR